MALFNGAQVMQVASEKLNIQTGKNKIIIFTYYLEMVCGFETW